MIGIRDPSSLLLGPARYIWPYYLRKKREAPEPEKQSFGWKNHLQVGHRFLQGFLTSNLNGKTAAAAQNPFLQEGERTQVTHLQGHVQGPHNEWGPHLVERGHGFSWGKSFSKLANWKSSTLPQKEEIMQFDNLTNCQSNGPKIGRNSLHQDFFVKTGYWII